MKLLVMHDAYGAITALAQIQPGPLPGIGVRMEALPGHEVLELDVIDELASLSLRDIHRDYVVDRGVGLTRRPG